MRAELNLEKDMLGEDDRANKMFGYLVTRGLGEGASLIVNKMGEGNWVAAYHFGREAPDSPMFGGSAFGRGFTAIEALAGVLDELGVTREQVGW